MKSEEIKKFTTEATNQLIAALNEGRSETLTQYLSAMARFHRYSLGNITLIASQRRDATRVAGFCTWNKLGRFVRKGEKAEPWSWWDPDGGEWNFHDADPWHDPHWNYNPWDHPYSPWQNVPLQ